MGWIIIFLRPGRHSGSYNNKYEGLCAVGPGWVYTARPQRKGGRQVHNVTTPARQKILNALRLTQLCLGIVLTCLPWRTYRLSKITAP